MPGKYKGGLIKCDICPTTFALPSQFRKHMSSVHGPPKFQCELCGKKFSKRHSKNSHITNFHLKELIFKCHCGLSFGLKDTLKKHIIAMHKPQEEREKFTCPACHKEFCREAYCQKHFNSVHLDQGYKCSYEGCNFSAPTTSNLKNHLATHSEERPFACGKCPKKFKQNDVLIKHVRNAHTAPILPIQRFVCPHCPETFKSTYQQNAHALTHRDDEKRLKFSCSICSKTFLSKQNFRAHVKSHGEEKGERIKCEIIGCKRTYANVACFKFHVKKYHENQDSVTVKCYFCQKMLSNKTRLYIHMRRHHLFERIYYCDTENCGKVFLSLYSLEAHKTNTHEPNLKTFSCNSCEIFFSDQQTLKKHVETFHDKKRAHQCSFCKQVFMNNSKLENHLRIHTNEKPFSCKDCNYQTSCVGYLRAHQRRMH